MTLELSRKKMRKQTLNRFKYLRTCVLSRELCLLVRANLVTFNVEDAHDSCAFIAKLCHEAGCEEPSTLCSKAAEAVLTNEEKYLELCEQSCVKCSESNRPKRTQHEENAYYVA